MTTLNKHTPGPWCKGNEQNHSVDRYSKNAEWARIRDINGCLIAKIESVHPKGQRKSVDFDIEAANADLIAAAPDMLEALKYVLPLIEWARKSGVGGSVISSSLINKAISKAEGRS